MTAGGEDARRIVDTARHERSLDLTDQGVGELPVRLTEIDNVHFLHLAGNDLRELPTDIGALRDLFFVDLRNNRIASLPPQIGSVLSLQTLLLGDNRLTELPDEIGDLTRLTKLYLAGNLLTSLPSSVGNLERLSELDLQGNDLRSLPASLGDLPELQVIHVGQNDLKSLPSELAVSVRRGLVVRGLDTNPSLAHLAGLEWDALAAYLESLSDAVAVYEAKLLLVGEGEVGKSSLVRSLTGASFVEGLPTTHGIDIRSVEVPHPSRDTDIVLHGWDFGGQQVYRITHQFFFSPGALYLLVWNARKGAEQCDVEGWLRRIRSRIGGGVSVILVATHSSRRPEIDYPALRARFPSLLSGVLSVDNSNGEGIAGLRSAISESAAQLPVMGRLLSSRWLRAREAITAESRRHPYITYEEFGRLCTGSGLGARAVAAMAELLHELGDIVHYGDDDGLREIVVLDPEWLTKAISFVLEDAVTADERGVLDHVRLREIWGTAGGRSYPVASHAYLLRLMEKFEISFRLDEVEHRSLVAQMVPFARPELPWEPADPGGRSLSLLCEMSDEAPGLISWLTVRWHTHSRNLHWRHGVFLRHVIPAYESEAVFEMVGRRSLRLTVRAESPDLYFNSLRDGLESLLRRRWPGLTYELFVPCPGTEGFPCDGLFKLTSLLRAREKGRTAVDCHECLDPADINQMLTGFALPATSADERLREMREQIAVLQDSTMRVERHVAESADLARRTLVTIGAEITDCPRLFTLSTPDGGAAQKVASVATVGYRLSLWCEQPGAWHVCRAEPYAFSRPRDWVVRVAPYVHLLVRTLKLALPVAKDVVGVLVPEEQLKSSKAELELMKTLADKLPQPDEPNRSRPVEGSLQLLEGATLRNFRSLLLEIDPARSFAGLRRVMQPSGEFSWVCEDHFAQYDPGLPPMPV